MEGKSKIFVLKEMSVDEIRVDINTGNWSPGANFGAGFPL